MKSAFGDILVGEDIPTVLPAAPGLSVVVGVRRDITAISQEYPWSALLRGRRKKGERTMAHRRELAATRRALEKVRRLRDAQHELAGDLRTADRGRIITSR